MLALVVADRNLVGVVEEDVGRHEGGIGEETRRHRFLLLALLLELRHAAKLAVGRDAADDPCALRVCRHVALEEDRRTLGIEAGGEKHRRQVERRLPEPLWILRRREGMEVDDAEERIAEVLRGRVLAKAAAVVAEVLRARRLDAREDPHYLGLDYRLPTLMARWL